MIFTIKYKEDKPLEKMYEKAMRELDEFFGLNWKRNRPKIYLIKDKKTIDMLRNNPAFKWPIGWVEGTSKVYMLERSKIGKETLHKPHDAERYFSFMKHELAHTFFLILSKQTYEPDWLWEGTSMYLSGDIKWEKRPVRLENFLKYYKKEGQEVYAESGFAVKFLVEKYGKVKLLELIKSLKEVKSEEEFAKKFREIYGFELMYENFKVIG